MADGTGAQAGSAVGNEIFDVVDDADRVVGQAQRKEVHARGLKHRAVHVWVFNSAGELFVQRRGPDKDAFPGSYDSSAAGHLEPGEEYDRAAARELQEELSLELSGDQFRRHFKMAACAETGAEFVWVYSVQGDYQPVTNPAEIAAGAFWPRARVEALVRDQPEQCAPSLVRLVQEFTRRALWPAPRGVRCQAGDFHV